MTVYAYAHTDAANVNTSAPACRLRAVRLRVDAWATLGRAAARYWAACAGWAVGVVLCAWGDALADAERSGAFVCSPLSLFPSCDLVLTVRAGMLLFYVRLCRIHSMCDRRDAGRGSID